MEIAAHLSGARNDKGRHPMTNDKAQIAMRMANDKAQRFCRISLLKTCPEPRRNISGDGQDYPS